jgi:taurine dioxygenase
MAVGIKPFDGGLGAEVTGIDLARPLGTDAVAALHRAFAEHHVIAIRGQCLEPRQMVATSRLFGDLEPHVFSQYHHPETPLVMVLSNRIEQGREVGMADAGSFWHSDVSFKARPARATMLYAVEVPDEGGDTLFCDMTAAYEALPGPMKARLEGLGAVHRYGYATKRAEGGPAGRRDRIRSQETAVPPCVHPVIRTQAESGRKSIYINPAYTERIEGLDEDESEALKREVFDHCLEDRFRLRYKWRAGDVVAWDNAAVMHTATTRDLDPSKHRTLWRTIITEGPAP